MSIFSLRTRGVLLAFLLVPAVASSAVSAQTTSFMLVADSAYTSTSPVVSRAWTDAVLVPATDAALGSEVEAAQVVLPPPTLKTQYVDITAYTSAVEECDSDPLIAADGSIVFDGMAAANFLPFGTKFRLPDYFGDKIFEVRDRMNTRYTYRIDLWMSNKKAAKEWGIKHKTKVEIIEMGTNAHKWNDPAMKEARRQLALQD